MDNEEVKQAKAVNAMTSIKLVWLSVVSNSYERDAKSKELMWQLSIDSSQLPGYKYDQGLIKYK